MPIVDQCRIERHFASYHIHEQLALKCYAGIGPPRSVRIALPVHMQCVRLARRGLGFNDLPFHARRRNFAGAQVDVREPGAGTAQTTRLAQLLALIELASATDLRSVDGQGLQ
jgi:hypothetical protein